MNQALPPLITCVHVALRFSSANESLESWMAMAWFSSTAAAVRAATACCRLAEGLQPLRSDILTDLKAERRTKARRYHGWLLPVHARVGVRL